ncbi:MAG: hypothetical protein K2P93_07385 [Alphaproteobacteria bacterium]|nr:hypothetical protein [Alphaproteobacteria bacterium]
MSDKILIFFSAILTLWVRESLLAYPSLFFSEEEIESIHIKSEKRSNNICAVKETIMLSAIVYLDKENWTLWINDKIIHTKNEHSIHGFQIHKVTPSEVKFLSSSKTITLRPSQNYSVQDDKILDGMEN